MCPLSGPLQGPLQSEAQSCFSSLTRSTCSLLPSRYSADCTSDLGPTSDPDHQQVLPSTPLRIRTAVVTRTVYLIKNPHHEPQGEPGTMLQERFGDRE